MMTPRRLFMHRLKNEWRYHYEIWKTAVDWIIGLYLFVPLLIFLGYQYYSIWNGQASWLEVYPTAFTWYFFLYICLFGTVRLFVQEGDLLFIRQEKAWLRGLMRYGILYSFLVSIVLVSSLSIALFPVWYVYETVSFVQLALFIPFALLTRINAQFVRQLLSIHFKRWKLSFINIGFVAVLFLLFTIFLRSPSAVQFVIVLSLGFSGILLYKMRLNMLWSFHIDCLREGQQRLKLATSFISASGYKVEKKFRKNKEPFILFSNSAHIFNNRNNSNIMTEIIIKFVVRNKTKLFVLLQLFACFTVAIVLTPFWLKWVVLIFSLFSVIHYVRSSWGELKDHLFLKLYPASNHEETALAIKRSLVFMTVPICFLLGFITGWSAFSPWVGLAIALTISILAYFYIMKELLIEPVQKDRL